MNRNESRRNFESRARMRLIRVGEGRPIELDRCPRGHGIWLDAGELAAVVRAFAPRDDAGVARFLGDLFRHSLSDKTEED